MTKLKLASAIAAGTFAALAVAAPSFADALDPAANALKAANVFTSDPQLSDDQARDLSAQISATGDPIFVAVIPDIGGNYDSIPKALGQRTGRQGVFAAVVGHKFRAGSSSGSGLKSGQAATLATRAFQENNPANTPGHTIVPMLQDYVKLVHQQLGINRNPGASGSKFQSPPKEKDSHVVAILGTIFGGIVAIALAIWGFVTLSNRRRERAEAAEEERAFQALKRTTDSRLAQVAAGILKYEPLVATNRGADAALSDVNSAYGRASSVLLNAQTRQEVLDVAATVSDAEAGLDDVAAYMAGRDPVAERAETERIANEEAAKRAAERKVRQEEEERKAAAAAAKERAKYERKMSSYEPHNRQSTTYNNYFGGGYYSGQYYAPGYYSDPFWNFLVMDALFDHHQHDYDSGDHGDYDRDTNSGGGGDWSTSDSSYSSSGSGGGGDWGSSSSSYDSGSSSGGGDWGGGSSDSSSSGGGGDW